jgi:hypothetical protein
VALDVYVGPLARYYSLEWETVMQRIGREQGLEVRIMRPPGFEKPDPEVALRAVTTWRKAFGDAIAVPMRWDESLSGDYETDRPGWDGYHAVRYLALHEEFPDLPTPAMITMETLGTLEREPLERRFGEVYAGRSQSRLGRLLGRRPPEPSAPPRYPNIQTPELWLPVPLEGLLRGQGPNGNEMTIGSIDSLVAELERVNDHTLRMDPAALDAARQAGQPEDGGFDDLAPYGLAVFLILARIARDRAQPMILDY